MDTDECVEPYVFKPYKFELVKSSPSSEVPAPRSGHRIVCCAKYLYLFGGYNPHVDDFLGTKNQFKEVWKFNFAARKWEKCAEGERFPRAVVSAAAIRRRQKLLIYGGTGVPFGLASSNELHSIKLPDTASCSKLRIIGEGPGPRYGQAIVMSKNSLYTIGGTNGFEYDCNVHRVNLTENPRIWMPLYKGKSRENLEDADGSYHPEGRYRHEVGFDGENIYVIGGGTATYSFDLTDIPVFNLKSRTWRKRRSNGDFKNDPAYPPARRCHGVAQMKTDAGIQAFVVGGYEDAMHAFNDLWKLELPTLQWTLLQKNILPKALYFHSTTLTRDGKMYVFGGIEEGPTLKRTNDIYAAWMRIPKLSEIAWEAVLHYFPNVRSKAVVSGMPLPTHFLDRLE